MEVDWILRELSKQAARTTTLSNKRRIVKLYIFFTQSNERLSLRLEY